MSDEKAPKKPRKPRAPRNPKAPPKDPVADRIHSLLGLHAHQPVRTRRRREDKIDMLARRIDAAAQNYGAGRSAQDRVLEQATPAELCEAMHVLRTVDDLGTAPDSVWTDAMVALYETINGERAPLEVTAEEISEADRRVEEARLALRAAETTRWENAR